MLGRGSFLHGRIPQLRKNRQASGARLRFHVDLQAAATHPSNSQTLYGAVSRVFKLALLQTDTKTVLSRPRHQPTKARVAAAVAPCQKSALGRQESLSQQSFERVVEL